MNCSKCGNDTGASWKTLCITCWRNRSTEEVRQQRQGKIDRKVERLRKWADSRDTQALGKMSEWKENSKDWAYVTQPNINTSGGRAFTRSRERVLNRYDSGIKLSIEADKMRDQAYWLEKRGAVVKGDADRKRQAERDAMDKLVQVGSKLIYPLFAQPLCTVVKINKKTYTVKFDHGSQYALEKSFFQIAN
jgi:hypothetical protein